MFCAVIEWQPWHLLFSIIRSFGSQTLKVLATHFCYFIVIRKDKIRTHIYTGVCTIHIHSQVPFNEHIVCIIALGIQTLNNKWKFISPLSSNVKLRQYQLIDFVFSYDYRLLYIYYLIIHKYANIISNVEVCIIEAKEAKAHR